MPILQNKKVLVSRSLEQSQSLINKLSKLGAEVVLLPTIEIKSFNTPDNLDAISNSNSFDWLIFTSTNSVRHFFNQYALMHGKVSGLSNVKIAAVGATTKELIEAYGLEVSFVPKHFTAKDLSETIPVTAGEKILIPAGNLIKKGFINYLTEELNTEVTVIQVYENKEKIPTRKELRESVQKGIDFITFTSGSAAKNLMEALKRHQLDFGKAKVVCIGPETEKVAKSVGFSVDIVAETHNENGLITAIQKIA